MAQKYPAPLYVLQTETGFYVGMAHPTLDALLANMITYHPALSSKTTASFAARNATAHPVATDMNIGTPYVLITDEEIAQLGASFFALQTQCFYAAFWTQLPEWQARYPGANCFMQLSRVGFDSSLDQALVYAGTNCGYVQEGGFYVLPKCTSGWLVTYQGGEWQS